MATEPKCIQKANKILNSPDLNIFVGGMWSEIIGNLTFGYYYWKKLSPKQTGLLTKLVNNYSEENTSLLKRMMEFLKTAESGWGKSTLYDLTKNMRDLGTLSDKQKKLAKDIMTNEDNRSK